MTELSTSLKESRWQDTFVRGEPQKLDAALEFLESHLPPGWIRDEMREQRLKDANIWQTGTRLYSFSDSKGQAIASVAVCRVDPNYVKAGQAVPLGPPNSDYQIFQERVIEFMDCIFQPAMEAVGLSIKLRTRLHPVDSDLARAARHALQDFIEAAPKSVSRFQDENRRRWQ